MWESDNEVHSSPERIQSKDKDLNLTYQLAELRTANETSKMTLYEQCLDYICFEISKLRRSFENRNLNLKEFAAYIPINICEDIISRLQVDSEGRNSFPIFCRLGMKTLKISEFNREFSIEDIADILKGITSIAFNYTTISEEELKTLIRKIPNVTHLNLRYTYTSDSVLEVIATCCTKLEELDISECPITDNGLKLLCHDASDCSSNRCNSLKSLIIYHILDFSADEVKFTADGLIYVLKHHRLHQLKLNPFNQTETINKYVHQYPNSFLYLRQLNLICKNSLDLRKILISTPYLTELCLYAVVLTVEDLVSLPKMNHLLKFSIAATVDFQSLEYFLFVSGKNLTELRMKYFRHVDVSLIGFLCPSLRCLKLYRISYMYYCREEVENSTALFQYLSELYIHHLQDFNVITMWKKLMKNCPVLQRLVLSSSDCFNDEWISQIVPYLKELRLIYLFNCYQVQKRGMLHIIEKLPNLLYFLIKVEDMSLCNNMLVEIYNYIISEGLNVLFSFEDDNTSHGIYEYKLYRDIFFNENVENFSIIDNYHIEI